MEEKRLIDAGRVEDSEDPQRCSGCPMENGGGPDLSLKSWPPPKAGWVAQRLLRWWKIKWELRTCSGMDAAAYMDGN